MQWCDPGKLDVVGNQSDPLQRGKFAPAAAMGSQLRGKPYCPYPQIAAFGFFFQALLQRVNIRIIQSGVLIHAVHPR